MQVCIFSLKSYGESGTELPPPVKQSKQVAVWQQAFESNAAFKFRMDDLGILIRNAFAHQFVKPYSIHNSCDWQFIQMSGETDLLKIVMDEFK